MNRILILALFAIVNLVFAGTAMATPSIDTAEACIDGSDFGFVVELTETDNPADPIRVRIDAESDPFVTPAERISINFDTFDGVVDIAEVETFGTPPLDRWLDDTIPATNLTVTDLGEGSWRVEGVVPNGTEPLAPGDEVAFFWVRTAFGNVYTTNVPVTACAGAESSFVSEVNLDDGLPWSPNTAGDTVATNGQIVWLEPGQTIDVGMTIRLNEVDEWRCTESLLSDSIVSVLDLVDHADSDGSGPAFASFTVVAPGVAGVYDLQLTGYPNDDCTGDPIATLSLQRAVEVISISISDGFRGFVNKVARRAKVPRGTARTVLRALRDVTNEALLEGDWVVWNGIGVFGGCTDPSTQTVCFRSERETVQYMRRAVADVLGEMATNPNTFNFAPIPPELVGEIEAFDASVEDLLSSRVPDFVGFMWFALSDPDAENSLEDQPRRGSQTKSELVNNVHLRALVDGGIGLTLEATGRLLDIIFDTFTGSINDKQSFSYPGFGSFTVKHRKAREGHNPRTGEPISLPATYTVSFKRCARTPTRRPTCH